MSTEEMRHALEAAGYEFEMDKHSTGIYAPNEIETDWDIPFGWLHMNFEDILKTEEAATVIRAAYKAMTESA